MCPVPYQLRNLLERFVHAAVSVFVIFVSLLHYILHSLIAQNKTCWDNHTRLSSHWCNGFCFICWLFISWLLEWLHQYLDCASFPIYGRSSSWQFQICEASWWHVPWTIRQSQKCCIEYCLDISLQYTVQHSVWWKVDIVCYRAQLYGKLKRTTGRTVCKSSGS